MCEVVAPDYTGNKSGDQDFTPRDLTPEPRLSPTSSRQEVKSSPEWLPFILNYGVDLGQGLLQVLLGWTHIINRTQIHKLKKSEMWIFRKRTKHNKSQISKSWIILKHHKILKKYSTSINQLPIYLY